MKVLEQLNKYGHEQVTFVQEKSLGLRAIIAVHNTVRGPALGGTRFFDYATEEDALFDVLRLSRGMTLKNAAAGLKLGGGKAVILGDPKKLKNREFLMAYGKFIDGLGGKYYTAQDMNISSADIAYMNETTKYVVGTPAISGDPAPFTARGVYMGMKAGAKEKFGDDSLAGKTILVQGIGSVGSLLCELLAKENAKLIVCDVNSSAAEGVSKEFGAKIISSENFLSEECDIFAPCAMGAIFNTKNISDLKCELIAGAANNVLLDMETGDKIAERGILYLPDYIINAGGVINCGMEATDPVFDVNKVNTLCDEIYNTTQKIIALAKEKNYGTHRAADEYAESQIVPV
jgi:leucine dehydrogenase